MSLTATLLAAAPLTADAATNNGQIYGQDRYDTALAVSQSFYRTTNEVVIASGRNFPDALVGGSVAAAKNSPLLLADDDIKDSVLAYIGANTARVTILGGAGAVSPNVENKLRTVAPSVQRVGGADRYDTARQALSSTFAGHYDNVFIASGANYPDALAGSAMAGKLGVPLMITPPGGMDAATLDTLRSFSPSKVYVLGGNGAVSDTVVQQANSITGNVERIAGGDRYQTAVAIAQKFSGTQYAYLASGTSFADALAAAPIASKTGQAIYLSPKDWLPAGIPADAILTRVGGPGVLSDGVFTNQQGRDVAPDRWTGGVDTKQGGHRNNPPANPAWNGGISTNQGGNSGTHNPNDNIPSWEGCIERQYLGFNYHFKDGLRAGNTLYRCRDRFPAFTKVYAEKFKKHFIEVWNEYRESKGLDTVPISNEYNAMSAEVQDATDKIADGRLPYTHPGASSKEMEGFENGTIVPYTGDPELDAESAFQSWKDSPDHNRNMLVDYNTQYTWARWEYKWGLGVSLKPNHGTVREIVAFHRIKPVKVGSNKKSSRASDSEPSKKRISSVVHYTYEDGQCYSEYKGKKTKRNSEVCKQVGVIN